LDYFLKEKGGDAAKDLKGLIAKIMANENVMKRFRLADSEHGKRYYATPPEIFARFFEKFVHVKMKDRGLYNIFMSKYKEDSEGAKIKDGTLGRSVYLTDNEFRLYQKDFDIITQQIRRISF
jgi:hypothetical protein